MFFIANVLLFLQIESVKDPLDSTKRVAWKELFDCSRHDAEKRAFMVEAIESFGDSGKDWHKNNPGNLKDFSLKQAEIFVGKEKPVMLTIIS